MGPLASLATLPAIFLCLGVATAPARGQSNPHGDAALQSPPAADSGRALVQLLDDPDLAVAGKSARLLGQMGTSAFPAIRDALASGSARQKWGATVALYRSTADVEPFLAVLTRQLSQPDDLLVRASLGALARMGPRGALHCRP